MIDLILQNPLPAPKIVKWKEAKTPELNVRAIEEYSQYINNRIHSAIYLILYVKPTLTLERVIEKCDKAAVGERR